MKKTNIFYWIFTILFSIFMLGSAIPDILVMDLAVKGMSGDLGYPVYFIPFIGVAKALGVIAILVPGNARLKEWAYAGLFFDLIGATYSIIASGAGVSNWIFMIIPIALAVASYVFYHMRLKAGSSVSRAKVNVSTASVNVAGVVGA